MLTNVGRARGGRGTANGVVLSMGNVLATSASSSTDFFTGKYRNDMKIDCVIPTFCANCHRSRMKRYRWNIFLMI